MTRPLSSGRIVITPLFMAISWTSTLPATSAEPPINRSGAAPLFSMVTYPPPILAPPGVARVQACVITRSPALTSWARTGVASRPARSSAPIIPRANDVMGYSLSLDGSERVFPGQNKGSAREGMEQEVLLVEEIIDPEIEREIRRRIVVDLQVDPEEFVEGAEHV